MAENNHVEIKLLTEIKDVLSSFPEYWDGKVLLKNKVIEDIRSYKETVIKALLSNGLIKSTYSISLGSVTIFKIEDFISMLRYKSYWENSYTRFSNEVGLTSEGKYFQYDSDVVLDFPHKDCVLEGGMTKESVGQSEIYYHNVLAQEEIDILLNPKVLDNIKKINNQGSCKVMNIDEKDNLIIKGNNLIALHSIKHRYAGKVKQIFIDPPYYFNEKKKDDTFGYNSNFKLSTWLTFMKNRLEIAKELLSGDGSLWITIDDDGSHYLKVLCDGIFGRDNFIANIIWQKKYSPQNDAKYFSDMHDHILVYAKSKVDWKPNSMPRTTAMDSRYTNRDDDPRGAWKPADLSVKTYNSDYDYEIVTPSGRRVTPPNGRVWGTSRSNLNKMIEDNRIWFGEKGSNVPAVKKFLTEVKEGATPTTAWVYKELYAEDGYDDFWNYEDVSHTQESKRELIALDLDFSTPKPERLLQRIINIGSNENDIVLDFFMGSATAQAVAMKMNRQFIGIEQMDYIETVSVPRLQKVIEGEQGGISKDVEWQGGGSFVYAELSSLNNQYIKGVQVATSEESLDKVLTDIKEDAYLNFKVDLERVTSDDEEYQALSVEEKKDVLIKVLDMNQLYLSYSEIEDTQHSVSEAVKKFNHSFYQKEGDGE